MNRRSLLTSLFGAALIKELPKPEVTPIPPVAALPTSVVCSALAYYPPAYALKLTKIDWNSRTVCLNSDVAPGPRVSPL